MVQVRQTSLEGPDGDGLVQGAAGASFFAGVGADAPQDAGKRAALQNHRQGRLQVSFLQAANFIPHPDVQGTGRLAGRRLLADALGQDFIGPIAG